MKRLANRDAGRNADDWRAWYVRHRDATKTSGSSRASRSSTFLSRAQLDDPFITALILATDPKHQLGYIRENARRMLATIDAETVVRLTAPLSLSSDAAARRALVAALGNVSIKSRSRFCGNSRRMRIRRRRERLASPERRDSAREPRPTPLTWSSS